MKYSLRPKEKEIVEDIHPAKLNVKSGGGEAELVGSNGRDHEY